MRNLKILFNLSYKHDMISKSDLIVVAKKRESEGVDQHSINAFYLLDKVLYSGPLGYDPTEVQDFRDIFPAMIVPKAVNMWYWDIYNRLYVCFENGFIISKELGSDSFRIHGVELSISEITWSPDEEVAAVVTITQKLFLINSDFRILTEIDLQDTSKGEKELINVGWGKKETQFHGSAGKKAALEGPKSADSYLISESRSTRMSWRGDSRLFAVGYWCTAKQTRRIKIFNNEGVLQCTSEEELYGIGESLVWKPQGNYVFFPQQLPNKQVISLMEKNGLKHGEISLPPQLKVKHLYWNTSSTILCVVADNERSNVEEILLMTCSNYHWDLKQKLKLPSHSTKVWWSEERENRLYVLANSEIHVLEWVFAVNTSYSSAWEEDSYVAVIDNTDILLTSFKEKVIPPPMYSLKLHLPCSVNQAIFSPVGSESMFLCAVLSDGSLAFFRDPKSDPLMCSGFVDKASFPPTAVSLGHWEWADENTLIFCYSVQDTTYLVHLEANKSYLSMKDKVSFRGNAITCTRAPGEVIIQTSLNELIVYDFKNQILGKKDFIIPELCIDIKIHSRGFYSLSEDSRLFMNGSQISLPSVYGKVTSFLLKDPYVLLTTSSHKLVTLQYSNEHKEVSERKIERGSRLITATCNNSVVLQAPRGNLETIQPRALVIRSLASMINSKQYGSALSLMRKQRIDLNLLVDHNQKRFIEDCHIFIEQIDPQWLTLFITELSNADVTKTSYSLYYQFEYRNNIFTNDEKVRRVCEKLLNAMVDGEVQRQEFSLPILSTLVKMGEMGRAIRVASSELALQHLMFIVDVNKLYQEALGVYDLQAALKIAGKSQKDPKEYIPYLNSLKEMEPNFMKYTIDKSLNKLNSALSHLSKCSEEHKEECMDFIRDNSLYAAALKLFRNDSNRIAVIAEMYGEHLYKQRSYEESGIMFLRGNNSEKAIQAFTRAGEWRQCMTVAMKEKFSEEKCQELAQSVGVMLSSSHKFLDAAIMYAEWLSNFEKAIEMYIQGKHWKEAIYTAEKHKPELLGSVKKSLLESVEGLIESIVGNKEKMEKYVSRLQVVRIEKQNRPAFIYDDMSDTASDASSTSSMRTKSFQSRSSKNTKKMNRKMWSLKEGNRREEEALVATLSQMIQSAEKCVYDVHYNCSVLLHFQEDAIAEKLQADMKTWLKIIEKSKKIIWPRDPEMNETAVLDEKLKYPPEITIMGGWEFESLLKNS